MSISIFNKTKTFFDETKKQSIDVKSVFKKMHSRQSSYS